MSNNFVVIKYIFHFIFNYIILINFWKLFIQVIESLNHNYTIVFFFSFLLGFHLFFEIVRRVFCVIIAVFYHLNFLFRRYYAILKIITWILFV